jgi:hypothetical protein
MPRTRPDRPREVRDARVLRAMAHPLRLTLLDLLERRGTLTSTEASEVTGESTASCSFHLRQLAKYGFVEPAEAANGRERPWRRATAGERAPHADDPDLNRAAAEVTNVVLGRTATELASWLDRRDALPRAWQRAAVVDDELLHLTATELRSLARSVTDLLAAYRSRETPERGTRAVRATALLFPLVDDDT